MSLGIPGYDTSHNLEEWSPTSGKRTLGEMTLHELVEELRKSKKDTVSYDLVWTYMKMTHPSAKDTYPEYFI